MEHGLESSYADFMTFDSTEASQETPAGNAPKAPAVKTSADDSSEAPALSKVTIVTRQNKLTKLMRALNEIGVTGVTITNVLGCGTQKGSTKYYRGVELEMNLLPKVKVEIVVSKVPVDLVIETARKVLYTGNIGDGKVFVYNIEDVVKVRTGETGYAALQDSSEES